MGRASSEASPITHKNGGGVGDIVQRGRIGGGALRDQPRTSRPRGVEFCLYDSLGAYFVCLNAGGACHFG